MLEKWRYVLRVLVLRVLFSHSRSKAAAGLLVFALALPASAACPNARNAPIEPQTSTVAGNGYPGVTDGPVRSASFVQPFGVAVADDGSIYVADGDAQNIRRIRNGVVEVFAGNAPRGLSLQQRIGGYLDGPALQARFNRPTGVAVAKDGTAYVADESNAMVRKISHGMVTTLARNLAHPYGIAVDDDGNVYVADFGVGLDEISPDGKLRTLTYSSEKTVCGVFVRGSGKDRILAYTDFTGIHLVNGDAHQFLSSDEHAEPTTGETHPVGAGCGVVALDRNTVAISDNLDMLVRFVRFPLGTPVAAPPTTRIISGGAKAGALSVGGYCDGAAEEALLDVPRGLALTRDGAILVADAGNRRIRKITGVDPRSEVMPNPDGTMQIPTKPPGSYGVVVIGNSFTFANALWPDSIAGQIEQGLIRDRASIGLKQCPNVVTYRFSSGAISDLGSFVTTYYGDHEADLVVLLLDSQNLVKELALIRPHAEPLGKTAQDLAADWPIIQQRIRHIRDAVEEGGAHFVVVTIPDGWSVSPLENQRRDQLPESLFDFYTKFRPNLFTYDAAADFQQQIAASGVRTIPLLAPMMQREEGPVRVPLFHPIDNHPSINGSMLIGQLIVAGLERWNPWAQARTAH